MIHMHREIWKFKQSALIFASPFAAIGIRDNNIYHPDNDLIWGYETDWTRSASSDIRTFSPDVRMQTL